MEHIFLKILFLELLSMTLHYILPQKVIIIAWITFTISLVVVLGLFFRGSETAIRLINLHTNKIADARTSKIESVC